MMKYLWFCLLLCLPEVASASDAYNFATTSIEALSMFRDATDMPKSPEPPSIDGAMKNAVFQKQAFISIREKIAPFLKCQDQSVRDSADALDKLFGLFQTHSELVISSTEKILNNPAEALKTLGTTLRQGDELVAHNQQIWELYSKNVMPIITIAFIDSDGLSESEKLHFLKLTQAERETLKAQLVKKFGPSVRQATNDTTPLNRLPPALLWQFLASTKWKSADVKK